MLNKILSNRVKENLISILLNLLDKLALNALFRLINKKKMIILMYHGIIKDDNDSMTHRTDIFNSTFVKQVNYLKKKRYKFINLTEWHKIVNKKKKISNNYVILTFDDGYRNVIEYAYPIMQKLGAKGCFYVISDVIKNNSLLWTDYINVLIRNCKEKIFKFRFKEKEIEYKLNSEKMRIFSINDMKNRLIILPNKERFLHLKQFKISNNINNFKTIPKDFLMTNWDELKLLNKDIMEIGCHTKTHPILKTLNCEKDFYTELYESKNDIEKKIGYPILHFCYPSGSYNKNLIPYIKKYGYLTATTTRNGLNSFKTDLFQLKRIKVNNEMLLFKFKVSGLYYFIKKRLNISFF